MNLREAQMAAQEPIAYYDFQEKGFYWAHTMKIDPVPVSVRVEPMPLYSDPQIKELNEKIEHLKDLLGKANALARIRKGEIERLKKTLESYGVNYLNHIE